MKLFHHHKWTVIEGSGFSPARALKLCSCGDERTVMYDFSKKKCVEVEGNYMEFRPDHDNYMFIIAPDTESFMMVKKELEERFPRKKIVWAKGDFLTLMKEYDRPQFVLAPNFMEAGELFWPPIRTLLMTGHF